MKLKPIVPILTSMLLWMAICSGIMSGCSDNEDFIPDNESPFEGSVDPEFIQSLSNKYKIHACILRESRLYELADGEWQEKSMKEAHDWKYMPQGFFEMENGKIRVRVDLWRPKIENALTYLYEFFYIYQENLTNEADRFYVEVDASYYATDNTYRFGDMV